MRLKSFAVILTVNLSFTAVTYVLGRALVSAKLVNEGDWLLFTAAAGVWVGLFCARLWPLNRGDPNGKGGALPGAPPNPEPP